MDIIKTVFRIKPRGGNTKYNKNNEFDNIKNEFYIASNEFSKQKLISFYGIEDCAITTGHGSCLKLEYIFGASTISRGSSSTLAASYSTSINTISDSIEDIKNKNKIMKKNSFKKKSSDDKINIAINDTINELKSKLDERNNKIKESNDTIKYDDFNSDETDLFNSLTSSDTIYRQSQKIDKYYSENRLDNNNSSNSIDYLSNNPDVVIDINSLKGENSLPTYLNKSSSSIINNINIHDSSGETNETVPKNEITINIDNATRITTITKEENKKREKDVKYVNELYAEKLKNLNSSLVYSLKSNHTNNSNSSLDADISINDLLISEESLNSKILNSQAKRKVTRSFDYLNSYNKQNPQRNKLYNSNGDSINKIGLFDNQVFLNKLVDRYSPQQRLSVSFNHLYDPLFVSNNLSKHYDVELKYVDLTIKDIYEHGLPYLLRSKRPLIEFCKELIKECQIEILFFVNDVLDFQKKLFVKQSDILKDGKEIYLRYLSNKAICAIEVNQSLKSQCVRDLKSLKKECFHGIALNFYKNLDFIYEEFKTFILKEHYENNTDFDKVLVIQKSDIEKKELENDLIKLVEIYYKSNDEALINKQEYIIERIKCLCQKLLN